MQNIKFGLTNTPHLYKYQLVPPPPPPPPNFQTHLCQIMSWWEPTGMDAIYFRHFTTVIYKMPLFYWLGECFTLVDQGCRGIWHHPG